MHPAYSVILFTTASGAGYGLLFLLGVAALFDLGLPETTMFGLTSLAVSLGLISVGLLSSTFHLGHPERAWRAFSQWETSWLSREGVAAVVTFVPAGLFALSWVVAGHFGVFWQIMGALSAIGAVATVWCTGMIYASLTTIRQWANPLVAPGYMLLALATGGVLFACLMHLFGARAEWQIILALIALAAAAGLKLVYFKQIDTEPRTLTPGDATGLGKFGTVRAIEAAHSGPNFVMREMGYKVARKHAQRLRAIFLFVGFGVTAALLLVALSGVEPIATISLLAAVATMALGVVVERWLFFGEAQHVVTLFYGAEAA
ncbi:MAG: dimethyl sulfoxide reductase anchor subunit family protein [Hyphomicrobiales bacterium]